jgi:RecA-family ATPase
VTAFVNLLNRLAGDTGAAVLLVGHPNKSGDGYSGSTAWLNAVRSQLLLTHDQDTDERLLMSCKANYSRNGTEVRFHWHEWAFLRSDDLAPSARDQYAEIGRANVENEAFLRCLRVRNDQGVERGVGPSPGPNYAPSQFERMSEARGIEKKALAKAMERLFGLGVISTQVVDRPGKSDKKTIIVEVK